VQPNSITQDRKETINNIKDEIKKAQIKTIQEVNNIYIKMQTCCTISLCLYVIDIRRFPPAPLPEK